jgi:transposase
MEKVDGEERRRSMTIATVGIDLGKETMHVVALDGEGRVTERRLCRSRTALTSYLARLPSCRVAMEACAGAHHIGRKADKLGHDARLLPGQYVRAYTKSQKNDYGDAEAAAEAATRPTMREVPIKSVSQQELQLLHRQRSGIVVG